MEILDSLCMEFRELYNHVTRNELIANGFFYVIGSKRQVGKYARRLKKLDFSVKTDQKINGLDTSNAVVLILDGADAPPKNSFATFTIDNGENPVLVKEKAPVEDFLQDIWDKINK